VSCINATEPIFTKLIHPKRRKQKTEERKGKDTRDERSADGKRKESV
jgi:hypothetical protein